MNLGWLLITYGFVKDLFGMRHLLHIGNFGVICTWREKFGCLFVLVFFSILHLLIQYPSNE